MKGLLLKDLYATKGYFKLQILLSVFLFAIPCIFEELEFYLFLPCLMSSSIGIGIMSYEEKEKWNVFAATLPYTRAQLVSEKYIFTLILGGIAMALTLSVKLVTMLILAELDVVVLTEFAMLLMGMCLLPVALTLPFIYKFGTEKGRLFLIIAAAVLGAVTVNVSEHMRYDPTGESDSVVMMAVFAGAYALSWLLSIRIYQKREL